MYNLTLEYVLNKDLDRAFELLNRELFSIQNTETGDDYQQFEPLYLPIIKHITIGPAIAPTVKDFFRNRR